MLFPFPVPPSHKTSAASTKPATSAAARALTSRWTQPSPNISLGYALGALGWASVVSTIFGMLFYALLTSPPAVTHPAVGVPVVVQPQGLPMVVVVDAPTVFVCMDTTCVTYRRGGAQ